MYCNSVSPTIAITLLVSAGSCSSLFSAGDLARFAILLQKYFFYTLRIFFTLFCFGF